MKLIVGIVLFLSCVCLGRLKIIPLKKRREFYISFNNFNLAFKNAVLFNKKSLFQMLDEKNINDDFNCILREHVKNYNTNINNEYLSDDEKNFVREYFDCVGRGDALSQIDYIEHVYELVNEKRIQCVAEEKKYSYLYLKLSIFIGLMLFIVVI